MKNFLQQIEPQQQWQNANDDNFIKLINYTLEFEKAKGYGYGATGNLTKKAQDDRINKLDNNNKSQVTDYYKKYYYSNDKGYGIEGLPEPLAVVAMDIAINQYDVCGALMVATYELNSQAIKENNNVRSFTLKDRNNLYSDNYDNPTTTSTTETNSGNTPSVAKLVKDGTISYRDTPTYKLYEQNKQAIIAEYNKDPRAFLDKLTEIRLRQYTRTGAVASQATLSKADDPNRTNFEEWAERSFGALGYAEAIKYNPNATFNDNDAVTFVNSVVYIEQATDLYSLLDLNNSQDNNSWYSEVNKSFGVILNKPYYDALTNEIYSIYKNLFITKNNVSVLNRVYSYSNDQIDSYYSSNKNEIEIFFFKDVRNLISLYGDDLPKFKEEFVKGLQALPAFQDGVNPFVSGGKLVAADGKSLANLTDDRYWDLKDSNYFLDANNTQDELANFKKASDYYNKSRLQNNLQASFDGAKPAEEKKSIFEIILQIISNMIGQDLSQFFPTNKKEDDGLTPQEFEATKAYYKEGDGKAELQGKVAGVTATLTENENAELINLLVNSTSEADFVTKLNEKLGAIEINVKTGTATNFTNVTPPKTVTLSKMGVNFAGASETLLKILETEGAKGYQAIKNHAILQQGGFIDNTAGKEGQLTQSFFDDANISKQVAAQLAIVAIPQGEVIKPESIATKLQNLFTNGATDATTPDNDKLDELWGKIKDEEITFKVVGKDVKMTVANFAQYSGVNVGDASKTGKDFLPALMNVGGTNPLKNKVTSLTTPDLTTPTHSTSTNNRNNLEFLKNTTDAGLNLAKIYMQANPSKSINKQQVTSVVITATLFNDKNPRGFAANISGLSVKEFDEILFGEGNEKNKKLVEDAFKKGDYDEVSRLINNNNNSLVKFDANTGLFSFKEDLSGTTNLAVKNAIEGDVNFLMTGDKKQSSNSVVLSSLNNNLGLLFNDKPELKPANLELSFGLYAIALAEGNLNKLKNKDVSVENTEILLASIWPNYTNSRDNMINLRTNANVISGTATGTGTATPPNGRSPKSYKEHLADYKTAKALIYSHYGDGREGRTFNSLLDRIDNDRTIPDNKKQEIKFLAGTIMSNYTGAFTDVFNSNMNKFRADPTADYNRTLRVANVDEFKNYLNRSVRRADRMVKRYSPEGDGSDIFLSENDYEFMTEKVNGINANSENRAGGLIKYFGDAFNQGNIARRRSFFGSGDLWRARQATEKAEREAEKTSSFDDPSANSPSYSSAPASATVTNTDPATVTNTSSTLPEVFQNLGNDPAEQNYLAGLVNNLRSANVTYAGAPAPNTTDNRTEEQKQQDSFYELAAKLASGYELVTNSDGTITAKKNGQADITINTSIPVTGGQTITGVDLSANGDQSQALNQAIDQLAEALNGNNGNYKLTGINATTFDNMPSGSSGRSRNAR